MQEIVLTEEQSNIAVATLQPLRVRGANGKIVGTFSPLWTEVDITDAKARLASNEPRLTTDQVLDYLRSIKNP